MLALKSKPTARKVLSEAAAWCSLQTVAAEPEVSEDIRRQRESWIESNLLDFESYRKTGKPSDKAKKMRGQVNYRSLILLSHQLRSPSLTPRIEVGETAEESERESAVNDLISKRRALLNSQSGSDSRQIQPEREGRLLVYWPSQNLADGAAEYSSDGFFNSNNTPPWDTWFHFDDGRLFAWVPDILIPLAQSGIDANPATCIQWADWSTLNSL
jgi:hypothetical protein